MAFSFFLRLMRILLIISLFVVLPFSVVQAQQETFPYTAQVVKDHVYVRAGQSANFESLCQLNRGDLVIVLDHVYSWLKIKLRAPLPIGTGI